MTVARGSNRRRAALGLAALVLLGGCARGVPAQRVASEGSDLGAVTDGPPFAETPWPPAVPQPAINEPTTTSAPQLPTTTSSSGPAPGATTSTSQPKAADPCAGPTVTDFPLSAAGGRPSELAVAADGAVWFTDPGTGAVGRLAPDGSTRMFPVSAGRQAASIAVGPTGDIWFTMYAFSSPRSAPDAPPPPPPGPPAIGRISVADGTVAEFPLPPSSVNPADPFFESMPRGIVAGPDGAMWFTETNAGRIGRITADGTITEYPLSDRHVSPDGIILGADGALWFHETSAGRIGRIDPATKAITETPIQRPNAGSAMEWGGAGPLVRGPDEGLWFGDWTRAVFRVTADGRLTRFSVAPPADGIRSIVAGPDGQLWFADQRTPALFRMTTAGVVSRLWTPPGAPKAWESFGGMAADGGSVWVAQPWANKITRLTCPGIDAASSARDVRANV
ncbi:MAG: hypothetical protein AB1679_27005 [Actinomycetota bacterium]|jgi:virginiamycin B lyase